MSLMTEYDIEVKKRTALRLSKVELLPVEVRNNLDEMLRARRYTQIAILDVVNSQMKLLGYKGNELLSRSALSRYVADFKFNKSKQKTITYSDAEEIKERIAELTKLVQSIIERLPA